MLQVNNLSVSFETRNGKTQAVKNVNFSIDTGEVLGIVGESGSGKSVTCYSLMQLIPRPPGKIESGEAVFQGKDLLSLNNQDMRRVRGNKISMIFQDPMTSLNPYMSVGKQISECLRQHDPSLSNRSAREKAIQSLKEVGIVDAEHRYGSYPHEFSGGMRQRVMIAMALATEPELLIADEPTTALDVTIQSQILELLASIQKTRKLAIIFISHDLSVVANIAQHVLVMKDGEIVEQGCPKAIFSNPTHPYTQKLVNAIPSSASQSGSSASRAAKLIEVKHLNTQFSFSNGPFWAKKETLVKAVNDISLDIYEGEILGLVGESGSGKSTLSRTIMRLVHPESGEILFNGSNHLALEGKALIKARPQFQMIFQDPYASLNPRMTVFDTIAEPIRLNKSVPNKELSERVEQLMLDCGLPAEAMRRYPHEFSGGQRQRIAIARALASNPRFIVADEPVSALDVTIQSQILDLLLTLREKRKLTMLFISHDLSVVKYLCERVAVMQAGSLVELGSCEQVFGQPKHPYTKQLISAIPRFQFDNLDVS